MTAPSPIGPETNLVTLSIKANGGKIEATREVLAIHVELALDRPPAARLTLRGSAPGEPPAVAPLGLGDAVEIEAGYGGHNRRLYSGVVTTCGIQQTAKGALQIFSCRGTAATPAAASAPVLSLTAGFDVQEFALDETAAGVTGVVRFQGSALAEPGCSVSLAGFGERFDGDLPLRSVLHRIVDGNWTTTVAVGFEPAPPGSASA